MKNIKKEQRQREQYDNTNIVFRSYSFLHFFNPHLSFCNRGLTL